MNNEGYFVIVLVIEAFLLIAAGCMGKYTILSLMVTNLFMVPIFGQKLAPMFNIISNGSNIPYAVAILCLGIMLEKYRNNGHRQVLLFCVFSITTFILLSSALTHIIPINENGLLVNKVFAVVPRIAIASITSFTVVACLFIVMYNHLLAKWEGSFFMRMALCCIVTQFFDSILFYLLAFVNVMDSRQLLEAMTYGFIIKAAVSVMLIPFVSIGIGKRVKINRIKFDL